MTNRDGSSYTCTSPCLLRELCNITSITPIEAHNAVFYPVSIQLPGSNGSTSNSSGMAAPILFVKRKPIPIIHITPTNTNYTISNAHPPAARVHIFWQDEINQITELYYSNSLIRSLIHSQSHQSHVFQTPGRSYPIAGNNTSCNILSLIGKYG